MGLKPHRLRGFIPARAGRTGAQVFFSNHNEVHPCACRADSTSCTQGSNPDGSSLRVQGGRLPCNPGCRDARFIPARAGRTARRASQRTWSRVHPCACRADMGPRRSLASCQGSSLRVQGGRDIARLARSHAGFIPARAGRTVGFPGRGRRRAVHPCACRADVYGHAGSSTLDGSSLRVQGGHPDPERLWRFRGFIPARAGRTSAAERFPARLSVHPCACRADGTGARPAEYLDGSSLRVQGGRAGLRPRPGNARFIPARAGRT